MPLSQPFLVSACGRIKRAQRRMSPEQYVCLAKSVYLRKGAAVLTQVHKILVFSCKVSVVPNSVL